MNTYDGPLTDAEREALNEKIKEKPELASLVVDTATARGIAQMGMNDQELELKRGKQLESRFDQDDDVEKELRLPMGDP